MSLTSAYFTHVAGRLSCLIGLLALILCSGCQTLNQNLRGSLHSKWRQYETKHLIVVSDYPVHEAKEMAARLEQLASALDSFIVPHDLAQRPPKMRAVAFRRAKNMDLFAVAKGHSDLFVDSLPAEIEPRGTAVAKDAIHRSRYWRFSRAYAQHLLHQVYPLMPAWLCEAESYFYGLTAIDGDSRAIVGAGPGDVRFVLGVSAKHLIMPAYAASPDFKHAGTEPLRDNFGETEAIAAAEYVASMWAIGHFALFASRADAETLRKASEGLRDADRVTEALAEIDLWASTQPANDRFVEYWNEEKFRMSARSHEVFPLEPPPSATELSEDEVLALHLSLCNRECRAQNRVARALSKRRSGGPMAAKLVETVALDHAIHGEFPGARLLAEQLIERAGEDEKARALALGLRIERMAEKQDAGLKSEKSRAMAGELEPIASSATQMELVAAVALVNGDSQKALDWSLKALERTPYCGKCLATAARATASLSDSYAAARLARQALNSPLYYTDRETWTVFKHAVEAYANEQSTAVADQAR
jgi:hypothetical protein